jgi:hypothetical protein
MGRRLLNFCARRALLLIALLLVPVVGAAQERTAVPQLVVISAHADRLDGTLIVTGLDFGEDEPRVTLGVDDLEVFEHTQGRIVALLPPTFPAGTYLLIVARGPATIDYDVFYASVPPQPEPMRAPLPQPAAARGPMGPQGPAGEAGPRGPQGPQGPSGRAELAGRRCPAGTYLAGFDAAGELACEALPAAVAAAEPMRDPMDSAVGGDATGSVRLASGCAGDAAAAGGDLPASWGPRVPVLADYPATAEGELRGRFGGGDAGDLLALAATESDGRLCLAAHRDKPVVATLELTSLAGAVVCACWSRPGEPCALSANRCAEAAAGATATLEVPLPMSCGAVDGGLLEVEIRPTAAAAGCAEWQLRWRLAE